MGRIMNGTKLYAIPAITANGVSRKRAAGSTRPAAFSGPRMIESSPRMVRHPIVRSRYEVKNGATTKKRSTLRARPALKAMK